MYFTNQIVAITGIGSGFGQVIARSFLNKGAVVFGCDIDQCALNKLASETTVRTAYIDLKSRHAAAAWIGDVEHTAGRAIDVLINNAGGTLGAGFKPVEAISDKEWNDSFDINIHAAFAVVRAATPAMKTAGRGTIVNISSRAGIAPALSGLQAYCSSKHALVGFTRQLAVELGPYGIRVNTVAPGLVLTDKIKSDRWNGYDDEKRTTTLNQISLRRLGDACSISNAVEFLASDLSSYITGQVLAVDGGKF